MIQLIIEVLGTIAFAMSGISEAVRKRYDIFGCLVCGFAVAVGGGTIRDLLLDRQIFWFTNDLYSGVVCGTMCLFVMLRHIINRQIIKNSTLFLDAVGLAAFTIVGTEIALSYEYSIAVAVSMGVITGCAGGIIRDIMLAEEPVIFKTELYASIAAIGSWLYCLLDKSQITELTVFTGIIIVRILAIKNHWNLPKIRK